jgi:cell wall-associated NlpC family hydrolase
VVVAGAAVWFVRWLASPPEALREAEPKPARDEWEFPEPKRLPLPAKGTRRRFTTSLALTAIFFAGAALAAGAGNEVAQISSDSTVAAATDTTTTAADGAATTTDAATPDTGAPAPDAAPTADPSPATDASTPTSDASAQATDAAPTPDAAPPAAAAPATTEPAPAEPATDAPTGDATAPSTTPAVDAAAGTTADGATADAAPSDSPPSADGPASAPETAVVSSAAATAPARTATASAHAKRRTAAHPTTTGRPSGRHLQNLPLVIPYHAIVFNPQAWLNDNPGTPTGQAAVAIALNYLGVPYRWGGAVPVTGFDCSGLTRFVYGQLGINLVHYAATQFASFPKLDPTQLAPGDLVFFEPKVDGPGHVGMYIGNDQMIEAPHTGAVVRISSFSGAAAAMGFLGAVRPYAAASPNLALMSAVAWAPASTLLRLQ